MILRNLKMENVRSYIRESVDFPEGTVLLAGDIGSGKSSILLAVEFALFGIMRGSLSGASLLRHGSSTGAVELTFSLGPQRITVKRTLKRASGDVVQDSGFLVIDGVREDLSPVELKSRVLELLGYPQTLLTKSKDLIYRYTVYTPQEEMKAILSDERDSRLDTLRRLFQVEKYRTVRENSQVVVKELRERSQKLEGATADLEALETRAASLTQERQAHEALLADLQPRLDLAKKHLARSKAELDSLEKKRRDYETMRREEVSLEGRRSAAESRLADLAKEHASLAKERDSLLAMRNALPYPPLQEESLAALQERMAALQARMRDTLSKRKVLEQQTISADRSLKEAGAEAAMLDALSQQQKEKRAALATAQERLLAESSLASRRTALQAEREQSQRSFHLAERSVKEAEEVMERFTGKEECPLCLQNVPHAHKEAIFARERARQQEARTALAEAERKLSSLKDALSAVETEERSLQEAKTAAARLGAELADVSERLARAKAAKERCASESAALDTIRKELIALPAESALAAEAAECQEKLRQALVHEKERENRLTLEARLDEREKRLTSLAAEKERLSAERSQVQQHLALMKSTLGMFASLEAEHASCVSAMEKLRAEERTLLERVTEASTRKASLDEELARLNEQLARKLGQRKRLQEIRRLRDWVEKGFVPTMHLVELQVMHRLREEFADHFQRFLSILLEGEDISVRLGEDFSPIIVQNGYEMPSEDLSGGEKTSLALAYRLAVTSVVNGAVSAIRTKDLVILDEPTDGFSSEQLDKLRMVLDELAVRQVVIVSHEAKVESFVEHVLTVHKSEHVSKVLAR